MKNFISKMEKLNIEITDEMAEKFEKYYKLLVEKNKVMNLTAITDYDEVLLKHFYDSLSIVRTMDIKNVETVIDVGTGGGFPGIPLKIVFLISVLLTLLVLQVRLSGIIQWHNGQHNLELIVV